MILAEGLFFSYTGAPPYILQNIDLEIQNGEYISIVGENGGGKTTLVRLALKLLRPTRGTIETTARRVGYVPQRESRADSGFPITVYEMMNSYRKLLKIKEKRVINETLAMVGMSGQNETLTRSLSGGQSQKTLIARALMGEPDLLILDEPSTGVDASSQEEIYNILRTLTRDRGLTIVSVEHNLVAAVANSTGIYHLSGGHGHICTPEQYAREYLGADEQGMTNVKV